MYPFGPPDPPDRLPTEPEQVEPEPEPEDDEISLVMHDPVLRWRAACLATAGMNPRQSRALALDRRVDIYFVIERLLKRGCDPDIAFDIAS